MLVILLAPHQNCRYQASLEQLSRAEIELTLRAAGMESGVTERTYAGHTAFCIEESDTGSAELVRMLERLSSVYMVCRAGENGAVYPLFGRRSAYLGDDLSGILKYKGKTSETFTRLLLNVARLSGDYSHAQEPLSVLDPVCGRGTTLLEAINAGDNAFGVDVDDKALGELESFLKRYLTFHHLKHNIETRSLTVMSRPKPMWNLTTAGDAQSFKSGDVRTISLVTCDSMLTDKLLPRTKFHIVAGDLPYGVQHAPHSSDKKTAFRQGGNAQPDKQKNATIEQFTAQAVPVWARSLLPGGAMALSFNTYTLRRDVLRQQMRDCGLDVMEGGAFDCMEHWVEQAVNRDIAIGVRHS